MTAHVRTENMLGKTSPVDLVNSMSAGFNTEGPVSPRTVPLAPVPQTRKSRVALACKRCKRRKQRCDGAHPSCRSCVKSNSSCVYERSLRPHYPGGKYISALEERIAFLEARLPDYAEDHFVVASSLAAPAELESKGPRRDSRDTLSDDEPSSLVEGVAYLSLCASGTTDTAPEPFYVGSSSGATIARMIQSSIFHSPGDKAAFDATTTNQAISSNSAQSQGKASVASSPEEPQSEFPFPEQAEVLFDVFFDRLHTRWPILDRKLYTTLFRKQYEHGALSIQHRSILHLIYAISARFLQLMKKPCEVHPQKHLAAAIEPMDYILEEHNLATVQFLLLLAVHGTRSPYGAGAWSQVRYAVTLCIELGLHRKQSTASTHHPRDLEIRRRVFWSCYCLDRMTSVVLGRTFAIADRDINTELPSDSLEFWDLTALRDPSSASELSWSNTKPFIHIIKLRRIQSKIHRRVYRVDKDVFSGSLEERTKLDLKMGNIRVELDEWVRTVPHPPKDAGTISWMYDPESAFHDSRDFFSLQYHKSILSLYTVLLPVLNTSDSRFLTTARSSACVCTAYKRLNQQRTLSYTMTALHSCFIAGLTLVYCIWRDHALFSYNTLEATRACSQSLTIFGEKFHGAVKYRDIFDALSGGLFKTIVSPPVGPGGESQPLDVNLRANSGGHSTMSPSATFEEVHVAIGQGSETRYNSSVAHAISDAVKEAFMEVDEEAPGGWQGWRMFNEMVQPDLNYADNPKKSDSGDRPYDKRSDFVLEPGFTEELEQGVLSGIMEFDLDFGESGMVR
ncbi:fungal specific transcription factor domain-containing protein [Colletotrichum simmondsii]|uniref:Fungal specific transcription factor domain-containing protein n=1 Tax=Colletotrichum simmondsii TaxID=703756 RepID=A0A135RZJ8_9PEZI|nr:fungal specific transcription factor domain-containing protein [Colletotrichum simmondsii]